MSGNQPIEPICLRVNDATRMIGIGRTKLYELIATGEVETVKIGKATRITTASLHKLLRRRRAFPSEENPGMVRAEQRKNGFDLTG